MVKKNDMEEIKKIVYKTVDGIEFDTKENALVWENDLYKRENRQYKEENSTLKRKVSVLQEIQDKTNKKDALNLVPEMPGVYMLTNPYDNFKKYIGSAVNLRKRYQDFLNENSGYSGKKINTAKSKTKPHLWTHTILELCDTQNLEDRENHYINAFNSINAGYNYGPSRRLENTNQYTYEEKKLKSKIDSNYKTFEESFNLGRYHSERTVKNNGEIKVSSWGKLMLYDVNKNDLWTKKEQAIELNNGNKVVINCSLLRLNKTDDDILTVDDIIYLPEELGRRLQQRMLYVDSTKLKTGVMYNQTEQCYVAHLVNNKENIDKYVKPFDTEEEAFAEVMDFKRQDIMKYTEKYKDNITEDVYNKLMNLSLNDVEKLVCC
jgi:hypothetical protein